MTLRIHAYSIAAAALLLSGCTCFSDACRPGGETLLRAPSEIPAALRVDSAMTSRSGLQIEAKTLDPTALAVGQIIQQLRLLVSDLANLAQTVGGEARATIIQAEGSTSQLMAELDARFKDRLETSIDSLEGLEKRMIQDAVLVITHTAAAANQLRAGAEETALITLKEANIASYEALSEVPNNVKERIPRLVYTLPRSFRIWADQTSPGGQASSGRTVELKIRGNFIDSFGSPNTLVNNISAQAVSTRNDLVVTVPEEEVRRLQQIQSPTSVLVEAKLRGCRGSVVTDKQIITVLPPLKYSVAVQIKPKVDVPIRGQQQFHFEEIGGCDSDYPRDGQ